MICSGHFHMAISQYTSRALVYVRANGTKNPQRCIVYWGRALCLQMGTQICTLINFLQTRIDNLYK